MTKDTDPHFVGDLQVSDFSFTEGECAVFGVSRVDLGISEMRKYLCMSFARGMHTQLLRRETLDMEEKLGDIREIRPAGPSMQE